MPDQNSSSYKTAADHKGESPRTQPVPIPPSKKDALAAVCGLQENSQQLPREFVDSAGNGVCSFPIPPQLTVNHALNEILVFARAQEASDVHLSVNNPIVFRKFSHLQPQTSNVMSKEKIMGLIEKTFPPHLISEFLKTGDSEFVHVIEGAGRFRITLMKQRFGWDLTARVIPMRIRSFEESGLPLSCVNLTKWAQGLVLVTGPAACGKTSTLATLVEFINKNRHEHIITIESPIEIVYTPDKCQITQRQIKKHSLSQNNALRAALREDIDILIVNELRDLETIQLAVTAAETGHLVFGTMNTYTASQTISSLINSFPPEDQGIITNMISESLRGIICQQLIPRRDGKGVVPCYEVLILKSAIANMIRVGSIQQINNSIVTGKSDGMCLFDHSLEKLVQDGIVDLKEAKARAISPEIFLSDTNTTELQPQ